jgi:hypothetical protein
MSERVCNDCGFDLDDNERGTVCGDCKTHKQGYKQGYAAGVAAERGRCAKLVDEHFISTPAAGEYKYCCDLSNVIRGVNALGIATPPQPSSDDEKPLTDDDVTRLKEIADELTRENRESYGLSEAQIAEMVRDADSYGARAGTLEEHVRALAAECTRLRAERYEARADLGEWQACAGIYRGERDAARKQVDALIRAHDEQDELYQQVITERDAARAQVERMAAAWDQVATEAALTEAVELMRRDHWSRRAADCECDTCAFIAKHGNGGGR